MYIIAGLGNPTRQYAGTRHNIGFDTVIRLSDDHNISLNSRKHNALCGKGMIAGQKVILAMPMTYMNLSGEAIIQMINYYKIDYEKKLIVIYDDTSLDIGRIRIRETGSAGGHNGMKNIISHLGSDVFPRIKIGIGEKPPGWDLADYVTAHFKREEESVIRDVLGDAAEACRVIMDEGIGKAMNQFN